ncbi:Peptidoglycan/xylan/chitin deacetylase, PgdA/CDA1 family [Kaistia soli DSM 19436]|uniref:Chitooligosaccharide deacetylase n=1 Tax=Kaistia soli DSM 19436 TaxID=1122133 RepID=A0A1M5K9H1_9HYPH|nr:polysaccharide deacetylase family protein [Kaistia soli]SHG49435.1 Peptidoglycan/xylan/chitin deacetylase, PgdA/CDA1 family [Kaistia soli DSM 19436]
MTGLSKLGIKTALNALYWSRAHEIAAPLTGGLGAILMFHHVRSARHGRFHPNRHLDVTPDFLGAVIRHLQQRDIDIVDLDEAMRRLAGSTPGRRFVVLTFDDGYRNNLTEAYPVLKAAAVPFTVYVATGLIDRTAIPWWDIVGEIVAHNPRICGRVGDSELDLPAGSVREKEAALEAVIRQLTTCDEDEQRRAVARMAAIHGVNARTLANSLMLDWEEVRAIARCPLATIGAHTVGHYALSRIDAGRARLEMEESRIRLFEAAGVTARHFAYPYGSASAAGPREYALAEELGFETGVTTQRGVLQGGEAPFALPRISVNGGFQAIRYIDLLLSGVPFALERGVKRLRGITSVAVVASASTR